MRGARHLGLAMALLFAVTASADWVPIPAGIYRPLFRGEKDAKEIPVRAFALAATPVTNGEFLEFVRANPKWQRSKVKRLFADDRYLKHWAGDTDLGARCDARQPVTWVSWFAAKSYAAWKGGRLPTTAEWEMVAGAGFTTTDGAKEPDFVKEVARWYATPASATLPAICTGSSGNGRAISTPRSSPATHAATPVWSASFSAAPARSAQRTRQTSPRLCASVFAPA
jgi:formylglycine-generating enzyme required for sulfatase activity